METFISIPPLTNSSALKQPVAGAVELPLLGHKDLREFRGLKVTKVIRANKESRDHRVNKEFKEFKVPKEIKVIRVTRAIRATPDRKGRRV